MENTITNKQIQKEVPTLRREIPQPLLNSRGTMTEIRFSEIKND